MLTQIYYYNYYKPYILKNSEADSVKRSAFSELRQSVSFGKNDKVYLLNKAFRTDVLSYAKQLSESVNGLRESSFSLLRDMHKGVFDEETRSKKEILSDGLREFVDGYNKLIKFSGDQAHSKNLKEFTKNISRQVFNNHMGLKKFGLEVKETGDITFNEEAYDELSEERLSILLYKSEGFLKKIHEGTKNMLKLPLSEHMRFKDLGYYYNYKYGKPTANTFKIIESGMLVDKVV